MIETNKFAYTALFTTVSGYGAIRATAGGSNFVAADLIMAVPFAIFAYSTAKTIGCECIASLKKLFKSGSNLETNLGETL